MKAKLSKQLEKLLFEVYDTGVHHEDCNLTSYIGQIDQLYQPTKDNSHIHIPIMEGKAHVTWHGEEPPSDKQMKAFEKMVKVAYDNADKIAEDNNQPTNKLSAEECVHPWSAVQGDGEMQPAKCLQCGKILT